MKKELNFIYKGLEQIGEIKVGLNKEFTFLEEIQSNKDNKWTDEWWMLFKQNSNNVLFILIVENTLKKDADNKFTNTKIRVVSKMRKLDIVNSIIYSSNKNIREFLFLIKYTLQIGVVIAVNYITIVLIRDYINPFIGLELKEGTIFYLLFLVCLTFIVAFISMFIWDKFKKTEVDIEITNLND